jgi:hypothetical protein
MINLQSKKYIGLSNTMGDKILKWTKTSGEAGGLWNVYW